MANVTLYNMKGETVGDIQLKDEIFNVELKEHLMHAQVVQYLANQRQGTRANKTRAEVRGGGRKPWRQKGTGRARQGSIRSPQWKGGGVIFAKKPKSFTFKINKKEKRQALQSALTVKVKENQIIVLDEIEIPEIKTKNVVGMLQALKAEKALIVTCDTMFNLYMSSRNIEGVKAATVSTINVHDLLKYDKFIVTKSAVEKIEEVYA